MAVRRIRSTVVAGLAAGTLALSASGCGVLGGSAPEPVASVAALEGDTTAITLDKGFTKALTQLELTPGVVGDARLEAGSLVFPITGGNVTVFEPGEVSPYVIGQVQHEGSGLTLSAGGTTVAITDLNVDPGASRVYGDVAVDGKTAASNATVFNLDGRSLKELRTRGRKAVLQGTKVQVSKDAAALLNTTFKTKAVKKGLVVGVAKITVATA